MDRAQLTTKLTQLIEEQLGVAENEITETADIKEDLGADSLDMVELVMGVEEMFDIEIPDEDAEKLTTVGSIIDYVAQKSGNSKAFHG